MTPSTFLDATALAMADLQERFPGMTIEPDGVLVLALDRRALDRLQITINVPADTFREMFQGVEVEVEHTSRFKTYSIVFDIGNHTVEYKTRIFRREESFTTTTTTL